MLTLLRLDPVTRKRFARFRAIKRGWYALLILATATILSLFCELIANSRPIMVSYNGSWYFPAYRFMPMSAFGQSNEFGDEDEADYRRLKQEFAGTENWVLMPPIPFDPIENDLAHYDTPPPHPPDGRHILGTDSTGRDVLARLLYGFRISIFFALVVVLGSKIIGVGIGLMQGYLGGWFDMGSQRFVEIWSTLPFLYVVILLASIFEPSFALLVIVFIAFDWIGITYYMRTEAYREKAREYVQAARAMGASHFRVLFVHLLPNCLVPLVTTIPFAIIGGIFGLTALDFLGYGLPVPTPSWGQLVDQGLQSGNRGKLWLSLSPFVAIVATLSLVSLIGESVREAFDPRQYVRYE